MYQQAILVGRLGKDPEVKHTSGGKSVATFSVATDSGYGEKKTTEWHNVVCWEKTADAVGQYLSKGSLVFIVGRIQTRSWDKDGETKYRTEVVAEKVQFLDKKGGQSDGGAAGRPAPQSAARPKPVQADNSDWEDVPF